MTPVEQITFAVIGAGVMGRLLARTASSLLYARCLGVADVDDMRAQKLAAECGGRSYHAFEDLLSRETPQAVFVATPESSHREPTIAAASHGCHVFVEKPLATRLDDADAMISACATAGVKLMTGYILRFDASYALIKAALDEGSIGRFLSAYARRNIPIHEARRLGGRTSPIFYLAVHDIDQMLWYHPEPVKAVWARSLHGRVTEELGVPDFTWLTMEFDDGALGIVQSGWGLPEAWADWKSPSTWGSFGDVVMNVVGTDGSLNLNLTPMGLSACDRDGWKHPETRHWPVVNGKPVGAVKTEVEHFFECVLNGTEPLSSGRDGRRSLEIALAAERSMESSHPVNIPLER